MITKRHVSKSEGATYASLLISEPSWLQIEIKRKDGTTLGTITMHPSGLATVFWLDDRVSIELQHNQRDIKVEDITL